MWLLGSPRSGHRFAGALADRMPGSYCWGRRNDSDNRRSPRGCRPKQDPSGLTATEPDHGDRDEVPTIVPPQRQAVNARCAPLSAATHYAPATAWNSLEPLRSGLDGHVLSAFPVVRSGLDEARRAERESPDKNARLHRGFVKATCPPCTGQRGICLTLTGLTASAPARQSAFIIPCPAIRAGRSRAHRSAPCL